MHNNIFAQPISLLRSRNFAITSPRFPPSTSINLTFFLLFRSLKVPYGFSYACVVAGGSVFPYSRGMGSKQFSPEDRAALGYPRCSRENARWYERARVSEWVWLMRFVGLAWRTTSRLASRSRTLSPQTMTLSVLELGLPTPLRTQARLDYIAQPLRLDLSLSLSRCIHGEFIEKRRERKREKDRAFWEDFLSFFSVTYIKQRNFTNDEEYLFLRGSCLCYTSWTLIK